MEGGDKTNLKYPRARGRERQMVRKPGWEGRSGNETGSGSGSARAGTKTGKPVPTGSTLREGLARAPGPEPESLFPRIQRRTKNR